MTVRSYFKDVSGNFMVPHSVIGDPRFRDMTTSAKWLYTCLCKVANNNADDEGWFWHSQKQLIELSGMKRRTIINAKKILIKNEFIDVRRGYLEHTGKRKYDYFRLNGFTFRSHKKCK